MTFQQVRLAQQAEITQLVQASIGIPRYSVRSAISDQPAAVPRLPSLREVQNKSAVAYLTGVKGIESVAEVLMPPRPIADQLIIVRG